MTDKPKPILPGLPKAKIVNSDVIKTLENALTMAKNGEYLSVAVIGVNPAGNMNVGMAGQNLNALHTGAGLAQHMIAGTLLNPQKQSKILRPM